MHVHVQLILDIDFEGCNTEACEKDDSTLIHYILQQSFYMMTEDDKSLDSVRIF